MCKTCFDSQEMILNVFLQQTKTLMARPPCPLWQMPLKISFFLKTSLIQGLSENFWRPFYSAWRHLRASLGVRLAKFAPRSRRWWPRVPTRAYSRPANQPVATGPGCRTQRDGRDWRPRHGPALEPLVLGHPPSRWSLTITPLFKSWRGLHFNCFKSRSLCNWGALYHFTRQPFGV